ncbi:peptide receptor 1 [Branchiostoma belcheri]|nr:peptide receptor 1 [Branchiostoma belcheri]
MADVPSSRRPCGAAGNDTFNKDSIMAGLGHIWRGSHETIVHADLDLIAYMIAENFPEGADDLCPEGQFSCRDFNNTCWDLLYWCDDYRDCENGYDENEFLCSADDLCPEGQFSCKDVDNTCLDQHLWCDETNDCENGYDENELHCMELNECLLADIDRVERVISAALCLYVAFRYGLLQSKAYTLYLGPLIQARVVGARHSGVSNHLPPSLSAVRDHGPGSIIDSREEFDPFFEFGDELPSYPDWCAGSAALIYVPAQKHERSPSGSRQEPARDLTAARPNCKSRSAPYHTPHGSRRATDRAPDGSLTETGRKIRRTLGVMTPTGVYAEDMPNGRRFKCDLSINGLDQLPDVPEMCTCSDSSNVSCAGQNLTAVPDDISYNATRL